MAQFINASVYGSNGNSWNRTQGVNRINVYPLTATAPNNSYSGVTCVSVIELLPTGLQTNSTTFYTDKTVANILAQGNAPLA